MPGLSLRSRLGAEVKALAAVRQLFTCIRRIHNNRLLCWDPARAVPSAFSNANGLAASVLLILGLIVGAKSWLGLHWDEKGRV